MKTDLGKVSLSDAVSLGDAFARLNEGVGGALVLVDQDNRVTGLLTDCLLYTSPSPRD